MIDTFLIVSLALLVCLVGMIIVAYKQHRDLIVARLRADVINRASRRYTKEIEKALEDSGASTHHDFGASTAAQRIYILAADRDLALAQLQNVMDKLTYAALRLQQKEKQVANLNEEANRQIDALVETPGYQLADTLGLPCLSRDPRVTSSHSWMLLEEFQRKAKLPVPDGTYQTKNGGILKDEPRSSRRDHGREADDSLPALPE